MMHREEVFNEAVFIKPIDPLFIDCVPEEELRELWPS